MDNNACAQHLASKEAIKRLEARMEKREIAEKEIETSMGDIQTCITELTTLQKRYEKWFEDIEKREEDKEARIRALELADGMKYTRIIGYVTVAIVGGVVGYIINHIGLGV